MEVINDELFKFIKDHGNDDPKSLLLSFHNKSLPFSLQFAALQIEARKKNSSKLSTFLCDPYFMFPDSVSAEQATDERVARFHSEIAGKGKRILDLTAGLGIDAMTNALNGSDVTACEINPSKAEILRYNAECKGLNNFRVNNMDCRDFLANNKEQFDLVYIDPARRDAQNNRTYSLEDCEPDVLKLLPNILEITDRLMIKVSPLLDVTKLVNEMQHLEKIYALCVKGECKELLLQVRAESKFEGYRVVDLGDDGIISDIDFSANEVLSERHSDIPLVDCSSSDFSDTYLYEPNAGVMKLPRKSALSLHFKNLRPVGKNTAIFVSNEYYPEFPGRVLTIDGVVDKNALKTLRGEKFNVVARNYPIKADELRKKLKLKEGSDRFLYAFRTGDANKPVMCTAKKIK